MPDLVDYRFKIDVFSPDTLPMARLAEYVTALAKLLGSQDSVHFSRVEPGSVVLVQRIEFEALPKVRDRVRAAARGIGPPDVARCYADINSMLEKDKAVGVVEDEQRSEIIRFPGREQLKSEVFGPFWEQATLCGQLVNIGGIDQTVPAGLRDRDHIWRCNTTPETAKKMAIHLLGPTIKVYGRARWIRQDGSWQLMTFNIDTFEPLEDVPLSQVVNELRGVPGNEWGAFEDPFGELESIRAGGGMV